MGVKLYLIPVDVEGPAPYGHTVLEVPNGGFWQERFEQLKRLDVPDNFACSLADSPDGERTEYGRLGKEDAYNNPIFCATAGDLCGVYGRTRTLFNARVAAAFSYLDMIPKKTKVVVLYS